MGFRNNFIYKTIRVNVGKKTKTSEIWFAANALLSIKSQQNK